MTKAIPYWHVDAFSAVPFAGNQAAVMVLDEWLPDEELVRIGAENLFAETAFVVRDTMRAEEGGADWELRWCTPTYEIALCGHATLASGHVLLNWDEQLKGRDTVTFRTRKSGILEVRRVGDGYEVGLPAIPTTPRAFPEAEAMLGATPISTYRSGAEHIGYTVFEFENEAAIRALNPDVRALEMLGTDQFICTARGDAGESTTDIVSRVFVPGGGVDEDSVTGSAHSVLTPYWAAKLGRDQMTAYQASERGGYLTLRLADGRAWLGGPCVTVVEGTFYA